jgi:hypothetical protein
MPGVPPHAEAEAQAAVDRWRGFPVTAEPRPTVLVGPATRPEGGFVDAPSKMAYAAGAVEGADGVPEEPLRILRTLGSCAPDRRRAPMLVTGGERAEAPFWTDRGRRLFSAWRLEAVGARGPLWVMDGAALGSCWFPPPLEPGAPMGPHDALGATLAPDGVTLGLRFVGGRPAVTVSYVARPLETTAAVCVIADGVPNPDLPPGAVVPAVGMGREVTVHLSRPLGNRVLVGLDGSPVVVTQRVAPEEPVVPQGTQTERSWAK